MVRKMKITGISTKILYIYPFIFLSTYLSILIWKFYLVNNSFTDTKVKQTPVPSPHTAFTTKGEINREEGGVDVMP